MKERPILFSAAMVRAILSGAKTQTRRVVNRQPRLNYPGAKTWAERKGSIRWGWYYDDCTQPRATVYDAEHDCQFVADCLYGEVGDRLWVKETHAFYSLNYEDTGKWHPTDRDVCCHYRCGIPSVMEERIDEWRPSIFMPRWASRITLEIVEVRVERLQDISEADAKAEGLISDEFPIGGEHVMKYGLEGWQHGWFRQSPVDAYARLWDSINGTTHSWNSNPWVWVITFRRVEP